MAVPPFKSGLSTLQRVPGPVLLVGPRVPSGIPELAHLVVGLDGSDYSTAILPVAASLAVALGVDLTLVTVVDPTARDGGRAAPVMSGEEARNLERLAKARRIRSPERPGVEAQGR